MENNLLLHPKTEKLIKVFLSQPFHFLILLGPTGAGKQTLAKNLAAELLELESITKLSTSPDFFYIARPNDKQLIPLENVRDVLSRLTLKPTGRQRVNRVVLINEGQLLSLAAQNRLLKSLEEAPMATAFIISVSSLDSLLPTIVSRAQLIEIYPVSQTQALDYFKTDKQSVASSWSLSEGNVGLLSSLLDEGSDHSLKINIELAKRFLRSSRYERLTDSQLAGQGREQLLAFLDSLRRVIKAVQGAAAAEGTSNSPKKYIDARKLIAELETALQANTAIRLVYLNLVQKLKL